jgi:hypothetical protein
MWEGTHLPQSLHCSSNEICDCGSRICNVRVSCKAPLVWLDIPKINRSGHFIGRFAHGDDYRWAAIHAVDCHVVVTFSWLKSWSNRYSVIRANHINRSRSQSSVGAFIAVDVMHRHSFAGIVCVNELYERGVREREREKEKERGREGTRKWEQLYIEVTLSLCTLKYVSSLEGSYRPITSHSEYPSDLFKYWRAAAALLRFLHTCKSEIRYLWYESKLNYWRNRSGGNICTKIEYKRISWFYFWSARNISVI